MKLIRNAIVYKAELPSADLLRKHLESRQFTELLPAEATSSGFVPNETSLDYVTEFEGGLAFSLRQDTKVIPTSAVKAELRKRLAQIEAVRGTRPGRKETREIKEAVILDLLVKAIPKSITITVFYDPANQFLIVPTPSKGFADVVTHNLIHAVGSVKTQTIHVSDIKQGLTRRLLDWFNGEYDVFAPFEPQDEIRLERTTDAGKEIIAIKASLTSAEDGVREAIRLGYTVTSIRFASGPVEFGLTSNFHLKSVWYQHDQPDANDESEMWLNEAAIQVLEMSRVIAQLCDLFGYKPPKDEEDEPEEVGENA